MEISRAKQEKADIGPLEAEVLSALKNAGKGSASEVMKRMGETGRLLAYTTVSTTLDRLYRKGLLRRGTTVGKGGSKYVYFYPENSTLEKHIVNKAVDKLVNAFGSSAVSAIYERLEQISSSDKEELKRMIEKRKGSP